jgi:ubiquinone/menaquinone biosynthesis C-methylase UbiE
MIHGAKRWNAFGDRVHYHTNQRSDLSQFEPECFDFIYTSIVLQHVRTWYARQYLHEFIRILKPGGVLLFQLPSSPLFNRRGITLRLMPEKLRVHYLRWRQRNTLGGTMEFYWIHRRKMVRLLERAGGVVEDVIRDYSAPAISYRYCVRKPKRAAQSAEANSSQRRAA